MNAERCHYVDLLSEAAFTMAAVEPACRIGIALAYRLDNLVVLLD